VPLPDGLDPDDVAKQGADAYQACLDAAMPLIDYKIHSLQGKYDLTKSEDKRNFLADALKVVRTAESESEKEDLLKKLRDLTGITYQSLERDLQNLPAEKAAEIAPPPPTEAGTDKYRKAARFILAAKLFSAPYAENYSIDGIEFEDNVHKIIAEFIVNCKKNAQKVRPSELFEVLDENCPEFNEILDLNYGDKLSGETAERFFFDSVKTLENERLNGLIERYKKLAEDESDIEKKKGYTRKIYEYTLQLSKQKSGKK
jgi:DNA primase